MVVVIYPEQVKPWKAGFSKREVTLDKLDAKRKSVFFCFVCVCALGWRGFLEQEYTVHNNKYVSHINLDILEQPAPKLSNLRRTSTKKMQNKKSLTINMHDFLNVLQMYTKKI